jgi:hypothetical protein
VKALIALVFVLLAAAVLAGCATADSGATTVNAPKISGYIDTSTQKHF